MVTPVTSSPGTTDNKSFILGLSVSLLNPPPPPPPIAEVVVPELLGRRNIFHHLVAAGDRLVRFRLSTSTTSSYWNVILYQFSFGILVHPLSQLFVIHQLRRGHCLFAIYIPTNSVSCNALGSTGPTGDGVTAAQTDSSLTNLRT